MTEINSDFDPCKNAVWFGSCYSGQSCPFRFQMGDGSNTCHPRYHQELCRRFTAFNLAHKLIPGVSSGEIIKTVIQEIRTSGRSRVFDPDQTGSEPIYSRGLKRRIKPDLISEIASLTKGMVPSHLFESDTNPRGNKTL